ncbi:bifunctional coenzyme A synthase-like isoform X2 [Liolophura sinensis]|uniref:bifunctional coenzyme A synthase-like isoform X2 n=1 Tax=Liolophura sinensis TaxID=3198878 RepID=UPI003158BCCB
MAKETRMFRTGLLVLTKPLAVIQNGIPSVLEKASERVQNTLYIHLVPRDPKKLPNLQTSLLVNPFITVPANPSIRNVIIELYRTSARVCRHLDVRVLLSHMTGSYRRNSDQLSRQRYSFRSKFEVVLIDECCDNESVILQELSKTFTFDNGAGILTIHSDSKHESETKSDSESETLTSEQSMMVNGADTCLEAYQHGVMGGTFDRLHVGHKILLSDACLRCSESVTVGVTDGQMNKKKTLCELILPIETRINDVKTFMQEVKPRLRYTVVPINDPFGPSTQDPQLQCIVVSQETLRGGHKVNEERAKKGLNHLDIHVIDLIEDLHHSPEEEVKISSSSARKRLLGTLIKDPEFQSKPGICLKPYRIGLTGGIASGKSSVCKRLQKLGAAIIDCDKLGHQVYRKGTECFQRLVSEFGTEIVGEDGEVHRRALGAIVFSDKNKLSKLNEIVWPEIANLAEGEIRDYASGK